MASVQEVYESLKSIANKSSQGFITPLEFNTMAPIAQAKIYNRIFAQIAQADTMRKRGADAGRDRSVLKQLKEDASIFSKKDDTLTRNAAGNFDKPDDLGKVISIKTRGHILMDVSSSKPVDVVYDEEKFEYILSSTLSKPTEDRPIAFISDEILLYPTSVQQIEIRYYKLPEGLAATDGARTTSSPNYAHTVSGGKEIFNASSSVDFELPDHYVEEIVREMAMMVGVSMRDNSVYSFGANQQPQQTRR